MSNLSDPELVNLLLEKQDSGALNELLERHSGIFIETAAKYFPQNKPNDFREFLDLRAYYVWDAARTFDEDKSQFHTWLCNRTRYACLTERTKQEKEKSIFSTEGEILEEEDNRTPDSYLNFKEKMEGLEEFLKERIDDRDRSIFYERNFNGRKFKDIAKEHGITTQRAEQINRRINEKLEYFK